MKLKIYTISNEYINYLNSFDTRVYDNKDTRNKRKYVGVVISIENINYYIPMSSPKISDYIDYDKKIIRKDSKTIIRIKENNRLYGTLRISNMIPVPFSELTPYITENEKDLKYKELIMSEIKYIDKNAEKIIKAAKLIYKQKNMNLKLGYLENTLDFKNLEEKMKNW